MKKIKSTNESLSQFKSVMLALLTMLLWGSLFPFIKIGYSVCNVNTESIADILVFAALRFTVCGVIVCGVSYARKEKLEAPLYKNIIHIVLMGLFAIVLHYAFTYVGLSLSESSKTAILKQLGALIYVCFAFLFIKGERFSLYKIIGALVGFCGIIAINAEGGVNSPTVGDILIVLASLCTVISGIMSKSFADKLSPFWITGISQLSGGIILFVIGILMGGKLPVFSIKGLLVFSYICTASIAGYTIWYYVQRTAELSKLFIIKFAEPLFACIFGALLLGENIFKVQYLAAFVLISAGIILANKN